MTPPEACAAPSQDTDVPAADKGKIVAPAAIRGRQSCRSPGFGYPLFPSRVRSAKRNIGWSAPLIVWLLSPRKSGLPDLRASTCRSRASPRSVSRGVYPRAARSADPGARPGQRDAAHLAAAHLVYDCSRATDRRTTEARGPLEDDALFRGAGFAEASLYTARVVPGGAGRPHPPRRPDGRPRSLVGEDYLARRLDRDSSGLLHWRTEKRSTTRSSTAISARTGDEAALRSGDGQPLYRAQERTRRRDPRDRRGSHRRPRRQWRSRRIRYRPRLPQARPIQDRDHCAAARDSSGVISHLD